MKERVYRVLKVLSLFLVLGFFASFFLTPEVNAQITAQQRLMAKRAAKVDALRNLLETVYGVRIDSSTIVRDFVTQSDVIRARLDAVIQGAQETDYIEQPDGTAEVTVEVTLGRVEDVLGRRIYYDRETFRATGYGAPSGSPAESASPPMMGGDIVRAKGNGVEPNDTSMGDAERSLMAKRAAKLDALRNLLEEVYGVRITSDTTVRDFVTQSDDIRARVHAFIQGARVVSERPVGDGSYEVEVEIELEPLKRMLR